MELGATTVNVIGAMLTLLEAQPADSYRGSKLRVIYAPPSPAPEVRQRPAERLRVRIPVATV